MRTPTPSHFGPFIRAVFVCFTAALILSSCAKKPEQAILGKWSVEENKSVVEYRKDGTMVTSQNGQEVVGKYKFIDGSHFEMEISGSQGTNKITLGLTCELAIHGDTAEVSASVPGRSPDAPPVTKTLHYTRVK